MIKARKLQHPSDDFILQQKAAKKGKKVFIIQAAIFLFCCFIIGISRGSIFAFMSKV
ncbi:hypothetical protein KA478_01565 [Patescibacteria group bacterium]|nr:hypothetical protein [Patescibacteria group bacterium]